MSDPYLLLAECEREQLHRLQAIQPWGCLLGGQPGSPIIRFASANLAEWTGWAPESVLGRSIAELLPGLMPCDESSPLAETAESWTQGGADKRFYADLLTGPRGTLDALMSCSGETWLIEFEACLSADQRIAAYRPVPHRLYRMPYTDDDWAGHCQYLADEIRAALGFERVMIYRFREDGCGEVITESLESGLPPYLGLRYPASDIPQIARKLYQLNSHRQIPDIHAASVPILSLEAGEVADLSLSDLRAVSPVHLEYLNNMGVTASISFSILIKDELWGLVACHHSQPRYLPLPVRLRCADIAQVFALAVVGYQSTRRLLDLSESDQEIMTLLSALRFVDAQNGSDLLVFHDIGQAQLNEPALGQALLSLVRATGAALIDDSMIVTFGQTPDAADIRALIDWIKAEAKEPIFATDRLPQLFPDALAFAQQASGMLAIRVYHEHGDRWFVWWRPEQPQTVCWAGDPRKSTLFDEQRQVLSPRSSFERWIETSARQSEPWSDADLLRAKKFRRLVLHDVNAKILGR
ncbi:GAF domain-containing protein [Caldichromatium japonicum]|uniref:GAF domain-containing protein n=1 Tax=Caldichromatium japonicum TaxID=2699430 RepID=A0A6G7VDI2_9GAMM|nr:GAF domain-containing protein [Caldichromatium japonicum]QIK37945.1 GAF domain-containing protein [Caldichromatium japonicum]